VLAVLRYLGGKPQRQDGLRQARPAGRFTA